MPYECVETSKCVWSEPGESNDDTESINDYRIVRKIGSGSFGITKLGIKFDCEDEYALKIMSKSKLRKMKFSVYNSCNDMFSITGLIKVFKEIEILKQLNHWNIICLREVIHDDEEDIIIIVTNYVSFGALFTPTQTRNINDFHFECNLHVLHLFHYPSSDFRVQDIRDMAAFPTNKSTSLIYLKKSYILLYLCDIMKAVSYLHGLGIAHRDIKPSNLLLSSQNTIVLADFGCAEQFNKFTNPYGHVSDTVGTPSFWAPECIAPEKYASSSDIGLSLDGDDKQSQPSSHPQQTQRDSDWSRSSRSDPPYSRTTTLNSEYETDHQTVYQYSAYALDMWAVGITLYAMCYNSLPFYSEAETEMELFELIVKHDPMVTIDGVIRERVGEIYHLPEEIRFIIKNLLEKYPHNRWNIEDLEQYDWLRRNASQCQRYGDVTDFNAIAESKPQDSGELFRESFESRDSEFYVKCVVFLDVDGVLTMSRCLLGDYDDDDPTLLFPEDVSPLGGEQFEGVPLERSALLNLKWLIDQSHADIVLSSTWRQMDEMRRYLLAALTSVGISEECVVGDTECMPLVGRGGEISHWLTQHPEYTSYVVLDDAHQASILQHCGERRFVQTILQSPDKDYSCEGLTKPHAIKALKILLGKYSRGDD